MADGDTVKMELTFWRDGKAPGDTVEVPADEVHRWKGFAKQVGDPQPSGETTTPTSVDPDPQQPADSAKVDDWRAYALHLGMEPAKAETATKKELQEYVAGVTAGAQA